MALISNPSKFSQNFALQLDFSLIWENDRISATAEAEMQYSLIEMSTCVAAKSLKCVFSLLLAYFLNVVLILPYFVNIISESKRASKCH